MRDPTCRIVSAIALLAFALRLGLVLTLPREWHSTLTPRHGTAVQEFVLPVDIERPLSAQLKLDLLPDAEGGYDVVVRVDGEEVKRYAGGLTRRDADLPRVDYYEQIFVAQRRTLAPDKAWYTIPINPEAITPGRRLAVEVALEGEGDAPGSVAVFGDYPPAEATYAGPSLISPTVAADTSLYKYLAEGDFRMRRSVPLVGTSRSRFHDGSAWSEDDLGVDSGRQQGRYRIFLVLRYERGIAIL